MSYLTHTFDEIKLQSGETILNAEIAYKIFGQLNSKKDNVIIYPTWYSGFISDNEWLIGEDMTLNPSKYFIIIIAMVYIGIRVLMKPNVPIAKPSPDSSVTVSNGQTLDCSQMINYNKCYGNLNHGKE